MCDHESRGKRRILIAGRLRALLGKRHDGSFYRLRERVWDRLRPRLNFYGSYRV